MVNSAVITVNGSAVSWQPELAVFLLQAFEGLLDSSENTLPRVTLQRIAEKESLSFADFYKHERLADVRAFAAHQRNEHLPPGLIFRLHDALRYFSQRMLDPDSRERMRSLIGRYCDAYAEGFANSQPQMSLDAQVRQRYTEWLGMAAEISHAASSILNPQELFSESISLIHEYSGCDSVALFLLDETDSWAVLKAGSAVPGVSNFPDDYRVRVGDNSPVGQCTATGIAEIINYADQSLTGPVKDFLTGIHSVMVLPLTSHRQIVGALSFHCLRAAALDSNDQLRLQVTADQIGNAIENALLYRELAEYTDSLEEAVQVRTLELLQAKEHTEAILNNSPDAILFLNKDGSIRTGNWAFYDLFRYRADMAPGMSVLLLASPDHRAIVEKALAAVLETGKVSRFRLLAVRSDGTLFDLDAAVGPSTVGGDMNGLVCNLRDVTDLVRAEKQVKASLRDKEVLLQEIHHRVKNNMQIIASLINLQASLITDETASQALQESQNRIRTMALIHERLYRSSDLASMDFAQYVRELVGYVTSSYRPQSGLVNITIRVSEMSLSLDAAIPCGLIINELVSNSLKHAFPDGRSGQIEIEMYTEKNHDCVLSVRDNGVGFPPEIDPRTTQTLGLQLVVGLAAQLKGSFEWLSRPGATSVLIRFPLPLASNASDRAIL